MIFAKLTDMAKRSAARTLSLRVGIVGTNFAVMLGLAAVLGLETFGTLAFLWGFALVAGTLLSLGGPLILLQALTDGGGLRGRDIFVLIVVYPAALAAVSLWPVSLLWPVLPWEIILGLGFALNCLGCLASVMRALGSVQWSMALRDAGPQIALGFGAIIAGGETAASILAGAALIMLLAALLVALWCLRYAHVGTLLATKPRPVRNGSLYGTSVLGMVIAQIDLIIGGAVLPADMLGLYALLRRVANLVALPVSVATWVSAAPISAAHGADDLRGLAKASAAGSQIAFLPGAALFMIGITALPIVTVLSPQDFTTEATMAFAVLLLGALGQVVFASSFTVATLCGLARFSVLARLIAVLMYLLAAQLLGDALSLTTNAITYVLAMTVSSVYLWFVLRKRCGIDTSAGVLLRGKGRQWTLS